MTNGLKKLTAALSVVLLSLLIVACPGAGAGDGAGSDDGTGDGDGTGSEPRPELKESVSEIATGSTDSYPDYFAGLGSDLYFNADDGTGPELWKFDGTSATRVTDRWGSSDYGPDWLIEYNGALYFEAEDSSGDYKLFEYSGGTVTQLSAESEDGFSYPAVYGTKLFFAAYGGNGRELFSYDGTEVVEEADINSGVGSSSPSYLYVQGDTLYFNAENGGYGEELWRYTESGGAEIEAYLANPTNLLPRSLTSFDDTLYFAAAGTDTSGSDYELWFLDPSIAQANAKAQLVEEVYASGDGEVDNLVEYGGELYFTGYEGFSGATNFIYRYDGTSNSKLDGIVTSDGSAYRPDYLTVYDGKLYFTAENSSNGDELWRYNGTEAELVWDINPGADSSSPYSLYVHGEKLFFGADDGSNGFELHYYQSPKS